MPGSVRLSSPPMNIPKPRSTILLLPILALLGNGCSDSGPGGATDGHSHAGHGHQPKNGGQLVEVGRHQYNLEILPETAAGRLTVWILDAHAENYVRVTNAVLPLTVTVGGSDRAVELRAVANPASGETVGDTAQFQADAPWLAEHPTFAGRLDSFTLRGTTFTNLVFRHPAATAGH